MRSALLAVLLIVCQDKSNNPFSKDYKGGGGGGSGAGASPKKAGANESSKKPGNTKAAVKSALEWLVKNQKKDGSWEMKLGGETGTIVTTSLCALAIMASDENKENVDLAAKYVAAHIFDKGGNDPKWDQTNWPLSLGGMFLAEYYADHKSNEEIKTVLEKVLDEIANRMEPSGGWSHGAKGVPCALNYVELEVMNNWMMACVGMGKRLGLKTKGDMGRAMSFIENCCAPGAGNVGYSPRPGQKSTTAEPGRTGGAIFAFACLHSQSNPLYAKMCEYWKQSMGKSDQGHGSVSMGLLESALGAKTMGGDPWDSYVARFFPTMLGQANPDGSFKFLTGKTPTALGGDNMTGPAYHTGIFALIMQLDMGGLTFMGGKLN
jgi:hypothetical protein